MTVRGQWRKKLDYWLDNLFYSGTGGLIAWLGLLSLFVILLTAAVISLTTIEPPGEAPYTFIEAAWLSLLGTLGEASIGGRETTWGFRLLMLGISFGGVFVISSLIGILTTGMQTRIDNLRKGRSLVMENGHMIILGWTEQVFSIILELIEANVENRRSCVVVMGPYDKVEMEQQIRQKIGQTRKIRVVCRTGNPMEMNDLTIASPNTARSIIVLSPEGENPDADVFKVILAITNHPQRRKEPYHIVASVRSPKNYEIAKVVGRSEVDWIRAGDVVSRMISQTCRQSGLSTVYTSLLDFGSDEVYFYPANGLSGKTFGEALSCFQHDTVIGVKPVGDAVKVNPSMDLPVRAGDELILISKDNSQIVVSPPPSGPQPVPIPYPQQAAVPQPEHTLILGWNWRGPRVIQELEYYVAPGSDVLVVADRQGIEEDLKKGCQDLIRQSVCYRHGDTTDRAVLESLELDHFNHVILLCYSDRLSTHQADAQTLITLLHLRDLAESNGYTYSIVTEMLDVRNRRLAEVTRADDFIVSDRLVSLLMAQVAENKAVNEVFNDLFNHGGSEIYLKPAEMYAPLDQPVDFYTVVEAACRRNEIAIGYRTAELARQDDYNYGVVLNPDKRSTYRFCPQDKIIVLSET